MEKKNIGLLVAGILVIGVVLGYFISKGLHTPGAPVTSAPSDQGQAVGNFQKIQDLKRIVAQFPDNRNAWVELGNSYFDSSQPTKAVDAYDKALKLNPDDPNVLTDQGVMYRRLGRFDKAVENFTKAHHLDPTHTASLYNLGVVYRYDLKNLAKAKEAWTQFLAIQPSGPGSDQVRAELNQIKALSGGAQAK